LTALEATKQEHVQLRVDDVHWVARNISSEVRQCLRARVNELKTKMSKQSQEHYSMTVYSDLRIRK
jgi:hypothetical protein